MTEPADKQPQGVAAPGIALATPPHGGLGQLLRIFALAISATGFGFVFNSYLVFWRGWPGVENLIGQLGLFGLDAPSPALDGGAMLLGAVQLLIYLVPIAAIAVYVRRSTRRTLDDDAASLSAVAAYIARAAFWAVLLVGLADATLAFLHVEGFLPDLFGKSLAESLEKSVFRGAWVHYPLIVLAMVIAGFNRTPAFVWLALLVVMAELQIVFLRFIFSYEQAFMADLVRFWYGALFLFSSAYTLLHEGHVRVDVLYAGFSERRKAWCNTIGSVGLGLPLCWVILTMGLASKSSVITGPLLIFEITQSGFGMYVKYLMAAFLLVYALSMLVQFMSSFLTNVGFLLRQTRGESLAAQAQPVLDVPS
ncbi:MAG: TRAP transporter small permease subunit [Alphaproteobacteria bacterium]